MRVISLTPADLETVRDEGDSLAITGTDLDSRLRVRMTASPADMMPVLDQLDTGPGIQIPLDLPEIGRALR